MHRHDPNSVRIGVFVVLPALWICVLSLILEEAGERGVLVDRLRVKVDRFEVRDGLAELAEIVEDDFTALVGNSFFADAGVLKEGQKLPLNIVKAPPLVIGLTECPLSVARLDDGSAEGLDV